MNITAPFWLVWCPTGYDPVHKHPTHESAVTEAERLARLHKGETFVVLESVCARKVDDMRRIDFRQPENNDVPF